MNLADCVFARLHHEDDETRSLIVSVLVDADVAVAVNVGNHVLVALGAFGHAPEIITPGLVREALRSHSPSYESLDRSAKLRLLGFALKDSDFRDMDGIDLLPLADGSFCRFSCSKDARKMFIPTDEFPSSLLPTLTSTLVDISDFDEQLGYKLQRMAREGLLFGVLYKGERN